MVQVTFDTNADTLEELEHALGLLQQAIARRQKPAPKASRLDMPESAPEEETALDVGFLKIAVKHEDEERPAERNAPEEKPKVPTLNQLLSESLNEEELGQLFKEQQKYDETHEKPKKSKESGDAYIEIIEYADEK